MITHITERETALANRCTQLEGERDALAAELAEVKGQATPKKVAECLAVLRPKVKGKWPQEQALEELAGYLAERMAKLIGDELDSSDDAFINFGRRVEAEHGATGDPA